MPSVASLAPPRPRGVSTNWSGLKMLDHKASDPGAQQFNLCLRNAGLSPRFDGGEGGIRTLGTGYPVRQISNLVPSTLGHLSAIAKAQFMPIVSTVGSRRVGLKQIGVDSAQEAFSPRGMAPVLILRRTKNDFREVH